MTNRFSLMLILGLVCVFFSVELNAAYSVEDAFPNLSFVDPVGIYHAGDGSNRLFVVEQQGRISVFYNEVSTQVSDTFLDIRSLVDQDGGYTEEGLLGLVFHPNYSQNGYLYVNYTRHNPRRNVIARYSVSNQNPNQVDELSSYILLEVNQPYTNHNGGQMGFGPDGYLYISFGDGGSAGDPLGNGQNLATLLGSLIRIDVDNPSDDLNYGIPDDNPFIGSSGVREEIYAYGLRNLWRFSWDLETGLLWGADVGQNAYEEIDIIYPGLNYGWNTMEGTSCYPIGSNCDSTGLELPVLEYELYVNGVCSITGGYVYRGSSLFGLRGDYIYGDWCTGDIWAFTYLEGGDNSNEHLLTSGINITSFGVDEYNELFFCGNEAIYKLTSDLGDLNEDGAFNVLDIVSLINLILSNDYHQAGDLNGDGQLNVLDIVGLVNVILRV